MQSPSDTAKSRRLRPGVEQQHIVAAGCGWRLVTSKQVGTRLVHGSKVMH
jgi:hypothetical protein